VIREENRRGVEADVAHVSKSWQRLVIDHDEFGSIDGDGWTFGNDCNHFLADVPDKVPSEGRLSEAFREERDLPNGNDCQILGTENGDDTGKRLRFIGSNSNDSGRCALGSNKMKMEQVRRPRVGGEKGLPSQEIGARHVVLLWIARPISIHCAHPKFWNMF
jgi:hypothetical protein